jgi:hypothetical protein
MSQRHLDHLHAQLRLRPMAISGIGLQALRAQALAVPDDAPLVPIPATKEPRTMSKQETLEERIARVSRLSNGADLQRSAKAVASARVKTWLASLPEAERVQVQQHGADYRAEQEMTDDEKKVAAACGISPAKFVEHRRAYKERFAQPEEK